MRPPSYYTSLANSNSSTSNRSNSSQQLRSSFSSTSSTSYATRTHLPFVPHTMLVAHCYTGVGSSTKPYGQSSSSIYSSGRLGSAGSASLTGSFTSSYSSRPSSTKRHPSTTSYTPRSSYLSSATSGSSSIASSSSYRRPSAYTYQPIRLRERPLLTRISNQISSSHRYETTRRDSPVNLRPRPEESRSELAAGSTGSEQTKRDQQERREEEQNWSSDVARNISRNKYLIKFREIDKRASIVPDRDTVAINPASFQDDPSTSRFESEDGPNVCVTVKLQNEPQDMRVPPIDALDQSASVLICRDAIKEVADAGDESNIIAVEGKPEECDKVAQRKVVSKKLKVPKERRNIKLKIKNVNPVKPEQTQADTADQSGGVDQPATPAATVVGKPKKKTAVEPTVPETANNVDGSTPSTPPTKTKVKRLAKSKAAAESTTESVGEPGAKKVEPRSVLKAKDSLLTKRLSDRKVLSPKQLNLSSSSELAAIKVATPAGVVVKQLGPGNSTDKSRDQLLPPTDSGAPTVNKRIKFREYNYDDFNFLSVLGHGGWGFVILAELKNHDACFAVKCIKKITIVEDDDFDSIMIERKVLTLGNVHPFICKLFCTFETEGYLFFAMEYCAGGDLMFHVQREGKFSEARSRFYAAEIICAIRYLHNQHIIYRDLKLDNILLDSRGHIRLVDFGMCQCRTYREEMLPSNFCGTPEYISPEIIKGVPYNHSVDWWSFGVLLYEMAVGKMPFRGNDENELLWNVCYEQIHYPMFLTKELTSLLQSLLEREPTKRMGMSSCKAGDIYDQAWFKGVDWRAIEQLRVPPPFVPDVTSERDVQNFDSDFTQSTPELSPVDESTLKKIDQSQFQKFPYTNPNISIFG